MNINKFLKSLFARRETLEEISRMEALEAGNSIIFHVNPEGKIIPE